MRANKKEWFIEQTAKDYDLDYFDVENIYRMADDLEEFYKNLEDHVKLLSSLANR